jgi:hypothetical protein
MYIFPLWTGLHVTIPCFMQWRKSGVIYPTERENMDILDNLTPTYST